jgi:hypothetical protein
MTARAALAVFLAAAPAAIAAAQDWSELRTLVFTPVIAERSGTPSFESAASGPTNADEAPPARVIARIQAAVAAIEAEQAANGEYSPGLIPLYRDLAGIYLEISGYGDAIAVLDQAQQVIRRNEGLYSLDQADLIEAMIEIEMAVTPSEQSLEREAYLRELVQRNPGDSRNPAILTRMAERQLEVADYLLVNGVEPTLTLNVGPAIGFGRSASPPTARALAGSMLRQARSSYSAALRSALNGGDAELAQLFELEDSIIDTYYFEIVNPGLARGSMPYRGPRVGSAYRGAIRTLEAQRSNISRFSDRPEAVAAATVEIADWHLMFNAFGLAMATYQEAMDHLIAEGGSTRSVAAMFSPETPVPLPASVSQANVFSGLSDVHGYVDVEIEINRYGGVRSVEVTGGSDNASDVIQRYLRRFVYQSRFRPRWIDGEWQREDRFVQRYAFGYSRGGA